MDELVDLADEERTIVEVVARFVDDEVRGNVADYEADDRYPETMIERMKQLGVYGLRVPVDAGGVDASARCFALVSEELARGWMSLAGAMGGHSVVVELLRRFGTEAQRQRWLPLLATGEVRATMALTEPGGGSDLQAMTTVARPRGDGQLVLDGTKTWITNAQRAGLLAVLAKTDPAATPPHRGMSILLVEPGDGVSVSAGLGKLGYRGVESCEVVFTEHELSPDAVLGEAPGEGFAQMMAGLELGRIQVAARATGVARAALDDALRYAQERETFGRPIWQHQAVGHQLADMATEVDAARLLLLRAAAVYDRGGRADLEAGMAKLFASEVCLRVTQACLRIHGGYGYSTEFPVERYYRDAPLMVVGEGTNEIQRDVIARQLVRRDAAGGRRP
jgi:alkylation response protein AidB-like acyl-CoA dehydrogenase